MQFTIVLAEICGHIRGRRECRECREWPVREGLLHSGQPNQTYPYMQRTLKSQVLNTDCGVWNWPQEIISDWLDDWINTDVSTKRNVQGAVTLV